MQKLDGYFLEMLGPVFEVISLMAGFELNLL